MPVQAARVSLDTAKTWAKRLAKTSRTTDAAHPWPLARCQLAVATMLGYDHWHALNQALGAETGEGETHLATKEGLTRLEHLGLPNALLLALRKCCAFNTGAFFFTGTAGSGKGTLMDLVVSDLANGREGKSTQRVYALEDPPEYSIPRASSIPVSRTNVVVGDTGVTKSTFIMPLLRSDPDILIIRETRDVHSAIGIFKAAKSGISAFSTCYATQAGLPERLADFGVSERDCEDHLRGWAYTKLLPVLCPHCSAPFKKLHGLRTQGPGCDKCEQREFAGRQLIVDLWQAQMDEAPRQLFSCMDQARDLIRKGRVSYNDVDELMGPVGL